jgi:MFS transporter, DHA1 family, multidrug resistance protein
MLRPDSRWFMVLLGALTATTALAVDMSLPALPALVAAFATTADRVQLTLSLFVLGYAGGQLVYGPLSDRFGRRPLLLVGLVLYAAAGFACALAPNIAVLVTARFVQGFGACVGPVLGRATVRDHYGGARAAQMLSYITFVFALAPMIAPFIGSFLLAHFGWPAIYLTLAGFGLTLTLVIWLGFAESLQSRDPHAAHPTRIVANIGHFFGNRICAGYAIVNGFVFAGLFAFISGSPFVFIDGYHVSPNSFGFYFALSAIGLMMGAFANGRLLRRHSGEAVLRLGLVVIVAAGVLLCILAWTRWGGPILLMVPIVAYVFAQGIVLPNSIAAAMEPLGRMAGMGASLLGAVQMAGGSISGYVVNALYDGTPVPMAATIALMGTGAFATHHLLLPKIARGTRFTSL